MVAEIVSETEPNKGTSSVSANSPSIHSNYYLSKTGD